MHSTRNAPRISDEHDRIDTNRTRSEHEHRVADLYVATFDRVK